MKFQNKKLKEGHSGNILKNACVFSVILNHAMKYHDLKSNVLPLVGNFEIESNKRLNYWTLNQFNQFYEVLVLNKNYFSNYCFLVGLERRNTSVDVERYKF